MKKSVFYTAIAVFFMAGASSVSAQKDFSDMDLSELVEVEFFAASVLSAHNHKEGEIMLSVSSKHMEMDGSRDGSKNLSDTEVLDSYMVAPLDMAMDMTMLNIMYAYSDDLTVMAMFNYTEKSMLHQTNTGSRFRTDSSGVGDTQLMVNYIVSRKETDYGSYQFMTNLGLSLPTGSIDERDFLPAANNNQRLPYPMQLGSGTYDILAGIGYLGFSERWYWGVQGVATFRTGKNDNGYTLGDQLELKSWLNRAISDTSSVFMRIDGHWNDNIDGADPLLNPMMVPTADPNMQAKRSLSVAFGFDIYAPEGALKGNRIVVELGAPIYQNLDGPQLKTEWTASLGWQIVY